MDEQSFQQEAALSGSVIEHEQNAVEAAEEVDTKPSGRLGLSSVPGLDELWAQVSTDFTGVLNLKLEDLIWKYIYADIFNKKAY